MTMARLLHTHKNTRTHTKTHVCTNTHIHTRTHTHTHTHSLTAGPYLVAHQHYLVLDVAPLEQNPNWFAICPSISESHNN